MAGPGMQCSRSSLTGLKPALSARLLHATRRRPSPDLALPPARTYPAPADDPHGVTDLSCDSGAIGRLIMAGSKEEPRMQVDLKGGCWLLGGRTPCLSKFCVWLGLEEGGRRAT